MPLFSGHIVGFDEYMNLVLDDSEEVNIKSKARKTLGRVMLKGDNITLIQNVNPEWTLTYFCTYLNLILLMNLDVRSIILHFLLLETI